MSDRLERKKRRPEWREYVRYNLHYKFISYRWRHFDRLHSWWVVGTLKCHRISGLYLNRFSAAQKCFFFFCWGFVQLLDVFFSKMKTHYWAFYRCFISEHPVGGHIKKQKKAHFLSSFLACFPVSLLMNDCIRLISFVLFYYLFFFLENFPIIIRRNLRKWHHRSTTFHIIEFSFRKKSDFIANLGVYDELFLNRNKILYIFHKNFSRSFEKFKIFRESFAWKFS